MGKQNIVIVIGAAAFLLVVGFFLFDAVLGETEEASAPISAVPLEFENENDGGVEETTAESTGSESGGAGAEAETAETQSGTDGLVVYRISQADSQVTFTLSEVLRGSPTTVVGESDQVAGEIAVDLSDLSTAQVGTIQVNARTLETDDSRRNQSIRNRILNTDQYEFITFVPTEVVGLSGSANPGEELTFQINGDLTIRDVTQPVTFALTVQVDEQGQLVGTAETTINRGDFDLNIPSVPFVADVSEEVTLNLDFTAPPA